MPVFDSRALSAFKMHMAAILMLESRGIHAPAELLEFALNELKRVYRPQEHGRLLMSERRFVDVLTGQALILERKLELAREREARQEEPKELDWSSIAFLGHEPPKVH